jgi:hypothetical protein
LIQGYHFVISKNLLLTVWSPSFFCVCFQCHFRTDSYGPVLIHGMISACQQVPGAAGFHVFIVSDHVSDTVVEFLWYQNSTPGAKLLVYGVRVYPLISFCTLELRGIIAVEVKLAFERYQLEGLAGWDE